MMATTRLPDSPPEETNNPGQDEYEQLTRRFGNPNDKGGQAHSNPADSRGDDEADDDEDSEKEPSKQDLSEAEQNPDTGSVSHENQVGRGYRRRSRGKKTGRFNWSGFSRRKKFGLGLGGGILAGGIISLVMFFLPMLRLDGYLSGINQRVFAAANNAVSQRVNNLFERYMVTKVISMQRCGNNLTADCRNDYSKEGFAKDLFNAWQDARVENKFFEQYGLEVKSYKSPADGKERFKIIDKAGRFGSPGDELTVKDGKLVLGKFEGGPRIFGKEWGKFIKNETRWDQVLQRRSVRKYLVRKHGTKFWCFFACKTKDSIDNANVSAKTKLKLKLVERTVYPFSQKYGLILKCLATGNTDLCSPDNLEKNGIDRSMFSDQDLADLKSVEDNPDASFSKILLEKLLVKIGMDEATAKTTTAAVPIVGQLWLALSAVDTLNTTVNAIQNGTLSKIAANINSDQYVEYYTAMRTADDEMKSGALPLDDAGALVSQFNDGDRPAEQSLVYQAYNTNNNMVASIFGGTALAASTAAPADTSGKTYVCSNGKPIPRGMYVCPEKTLNKRTFKIEEYFKDASGVIDTLNLYDKCYVSIGKCLVRPSTDVHKVLKGANWVIDNTVSKLLSPVIDVILKAPGIDQLKNLASGWAGKIMSTLFNEIFPLPLQPDSPGRDKYDALEAGGEITASEFNQGGITDDGQPYGLGGRLLSDKEQADATTAYLDQQDYDNSHGSLINRVASMDNPDSLLSRFAMAMPSSWSQLSTNVSQMFSHPFHGLGFMMHPAYADSNTGSINAFGVDRFGYTANDAVFTADPSLYTPEYCDQKKQDWQNSRTQNPVTGTDRYSKTDPCLLEQVAVEAASSVFTQDDSLGQGTDTATTDSPGLSSSDDKQLAQQILDNSNISYPLDASSSNGSTKKVLQTIAAGQAAPVTCTDGSAQGITSTTVDPGVLKFILDLGNRTKIGVNAITDKCHTKDSNHYLGKAVDFECEGIPFNVNLADSIANKYGLSRNSETCTANNHWHYSTNGK